ncbi:MAG: hypothetical protein DMG59_27390 [Acidobacteria bacterium]|jgi:hypothetical protein|nr:MAG: hypothetical protein DMG59_27390 [Acidobacteriota bacterium]
MKLFLPVTFCVFLAVGSVGYAQQQPPPTQEQRNDAVTLVGCLTKAAAEHEYVITDTKSGEKVTFPGPDKLDTYVNHTVQLTGKMMNRSGEKAFQPETVKMVSASCEGPQKR